MSKLLRSLLVLGAALATLVVTVPAAQAATTTLPEGYDVSYPQCGSTNLPTGAFGVVGVNGGLATTMNSCLAAQLQWAWNSTGTSALPKANVYLNTANPGQIRKQVTTWPTSSLSSDPYGTCKGGNDTACSWQYGYNRALVSVEQFFKPQANQAGVSADPSVYTWWLDVETANTWETGGPQAQNNNRAALEGWTYYLQLAGARVGLYSTASQWRQIVGSTVTQSSSLYALNSWLAGATTSDGAASNCTAAPLTHGPVTLAQFVTGGLDHDLSCQG